MASQHVVIIKFLPFADIRRGIWFERIGRERGPPVVASIQLVWDDRAIGFVL